jgi:hypothetical protein
VLAGAFSGGDCTGPGYAAPLPLQTNAYGAVCRLGVGPGPIAPGLRERSSACRVQTGRGLRLHRTFTSLAPPPLPFPAGRGYPSNNLRHHDTRSALASPSCAPSTCGCGSTLPGCAVGVTGVLTAPAGPSAPIPAGPGRRAGGDSPHSPYAWRQETSGANPRYPHQ